MEKAIEMMTEAVIEHLSILKNKVNIHMPFLKGVGKHSKKVPTLPKNFTFKDEAVMAQVLGNWK